LAVKAAPGKSESGKGKTVSRPLMQKAKYGKLFFKRMSEVMDFVGYYKRLGGRR